MSVLSVIPAAAQPPSPSVADTADRPGFADSPILLGRGHLQLESGFAWEHEGQSVDLTRTLTWPQVELHAGLDPRLEVSAAWDGLVTTAATTSVSNAEGWSTGWADVRLGAKVGLLTRDRVDAALIAYADLPVGSNAVSSGYADPVARLAWAISISDRVGLSGTADLAAARDDDDRVRPKPAASASLGAAVVKTINSFVGMVAESSPGGSTPHVWSVEGGLMLPLGPRTQIDVWASRRVAGGPDDWFIGAGFVRRLR